MNLAPQMRTSRTYLGTFIFFIFSLAAIAQVGIGTTTPDLATSLQIDGENSGVLINRVPLMSKNDTSTIPSIGAAQEGLLVYNTNNSNTGNNAIDVEPGFYYWTGTEWNQIKEGGRKNTGWVALQDGNTSIGVAGITTAQAANPANYTNIPIDFEDDPSDTIIDSYAPDGYSGTDFFNSTTNRISPLNEGDAIMLRVQFNAVPPDNNAFLILAIDIGTTSPVIIYQKTVPLLRGSNEVNRISETILLYQLATFVNNGASLKIAYATSTGSPGTVTLNNFGLVIERLTSD